MNIKITENPPDIPAKNQFKALVAALNNLKKGNLDEKIHIKNELNRYDQFMTTRTFPFSVSELRSLSSEFRKWNQIIKAVPHLFQKQKVIYLIRNIGNVINARIADKIYKNELEKKTIYFKSMKDFGFIRHQNRSAVVFQEYRFNYSRFFVEALKYFDSKGGQIVYSNEKIVSGNKEKPALLLPMETFPKFEAVVKEQNLLVRFFENDGNMLATQITNDHPIISAVELLKITGKYFLIEPTDAKPTTRETPAKLNNLYEILLLMENRLPCSFDSSRLNDYYEIGLEKFDLAKQTGISFEDFKTYFHRYGTGIDEITETAYQLLERNRDIKEVWTAAESAFQVKYEWRVK